MRNHYLMTIHRLKIHSFLYILFFTSPFIHAQTLTPTGSMVTARWNHCAQVLSNGNVLAFGGDNANALNYAIFSSAEIYNATSKTWSSTGSMAVARTDFSSVILNDGSVLTIGGNDVDFNRLSSCEIYDPSVGSWQSQASMNIARAYHASVVLRDGTVLVAGGSGDKSAEIYDPSTNQWKRITDMNGNHGDGMSLTILDNGNVLALGGSLLQTTGEIYNPTLGTWTNLNNNSTKNHYFHSVVRITATSYLIAGTKSLSAVDQLSSEIFNPSSSGFSIALGLQQNVGVTSSMVQLDDGKVMLYNLGNFFSPTNTKCVQLYNPGGLNWTAPTFNIIGANAPTVNRLHDGTVLCAGGSFTTGNGATANCYIYGQSNFTSCTPPSINLVVNGFVGCNGVSSKVVLPTSQTGVNYTAYIGTRFIGSSVAGGGTLTIPIPYDQMAPGINVVKIRTIKSGCPSYYQTDTALVNALLPAIPTPVITVSGPTEFCSGENVVLSAPPGMPGYEWSPSGSNNQSITLTNIAYSKVRIRNTDGCYTRYSDVVKTAIASTSVSAGSEQSVCILSSPFSLTGFSPTGGTWSGAGVSPAGLFDPAAAGGGNILLTYSRCGYSGSKTISVVPLPHTPDFTLQAASDSVCYNTATTLSVQNPVSGVRYEFWQGALLIATKTGATSSAVSIATDKLKNKTTYTVKGIYNNACGSDTLIKNFTVFQYVDFELPVKTKTAQICRRTSANVYIVHSQTNISYQLKKGTVNIGPALKGNGDTLFLNTGILLKSGVYSVYGVHINSCSATLTQTVRIDVKAPDVHMTLSAYNAEIGTSVKLINNTVNTGGNFQWQFGNGAQQTSSSDQFPSDLVYTTIGQKKIKLICTDAYGCVDSLVRKLNIISTFSESDCNYSMSTGRYEFTPTSLAFDQDDNLYQSFSSGIVGISCYSPRGDSAYNNIESISGYDNLQPIVKYNAKGVIQWVSYLRHSSGGSGKIITDSLGNVYMSYQHSNHEDSIRAYSTDGSYVTFDPPMSGDFEPVVVVKYDKNGIFQWYNTFPAYYGNWRLELAVDKDLNVYAASETSACKLNASGQKQWSKNSGHTAFRMDSNGYLSGVRSNQLVVDKFDSDGNLLFSSPAPSTTYANTNISTFAAEMDNKNNWYVLGEFRGGFYFNGELFTDPYTGGPNQSDLFICKIDANGNQKWLKQIKVNQNTPSKGLQMKNGQLLFAGLASAGTVQYNKQEASYLNSLSYTGIGQFIALTDTSAQGSIRMVKLNDNQGTGLNLPFHILAWSKKTNRIAIGIPNALVPVLGQNLAVKPFPQYDIPTHLAVMQWQLSCAFPQVAPVSNFTLQSPPCTESSLQFNDFSTETPTSWDWTFSGGVPAVSSEKNPTVVFHTNGTHEITLRASNSTGIGSLYTMNLEIFNPPVIEPLADIGSTCGSILPLPVADPSGGQFSGTGVVNNNHFDPSTLAAGDYTITYTYNDIHGCSNTATTIASVEICTTVRSGVNDFLYLYPNPCSSSFIIQNKKQTAENCDIMLYNAEGELSYLKRNVKLQKETNINVTSLTPGIYHLLIITDQGIMVKEKIIIL